MKKFTQILTELPPSFRDSLEILFPAYPPETMLFFDIETTGLSPKISSIYLIGACFYDKEVHAFRFIQYFADEFDDEPKILEDFFHLACQFSILFHYNGRSFDLPYLNARCEACGLPFHFGADDTSHEENSGSSDYPKKASCKAADIDIYQIFHKDKLIFTKKHASLINKKQKTMELLAGYQRTDTLDGKELIEVFRNYHKEHILRHEQEEKTFLSLLLLHNHNDLLGLVSICPLLGYIQLFSGEFHGLSFKNCCLSDAGDTLFLELETAFSFPSLPAGYLPDSSVCISSHSISMKIPGVYAELKFFYPDVKNYYYLPEEDMAVHKSVAEFVDKKRRCKATPKNCYIKKTGFFFPQDGRHPVITPAFYEEYHGKTAWFAWSEVLAANHELLLQYTLSMLSFSLHQIP